MVSLRSGAKLKDISNAPAAKPSKPPASKKRKAEEAHPAENNKENADKPTTHKEESKNHVDRAATPEPADTKGSNDQKPYEKTPGRDGPIKEDKCPSRQISSLSRVHPARKFAEPSKRKRTSTRSLL